MLAVWHSLPRNLLPRHYTWCTGNAPYCVGFASASRQLYRGRRANSRVRTSLHRRPCLAKKSCLICLTPVGTCVQGKLQGTRPLGFLQSQSLYVVPLAAILITPSLCMGPRANSRVRVRLHQHFNRCMGGARGNRRMGDVARGERQLDRGQS